MALTGTDRGTGSHNSSATSFTLSPASNFGAGLAVLCLASDNAGASGAAQVITVTDTLGNTWLRRVSALVDPGAASAGQEGSIFTTLQDGGLLQTGTVITITFANATTAKTWTLQEVDASVGTPAVVASGTGTGGTGTTSPTITTGSITSGDMVIAALFLEAGTTETITQDGDSTNGTWSTQQTAEIGSTTSGSNVASQRKVVSGTATQTYNPTLGILGDLCLGWIQIHELVGDNAYETAVFADGPVFVASMEEASGNITDLVGGLTGTQNGSPTYGVTGPISGKTAVAFSAGTQFFSVADGAALHLGDSPFTIEFWLRRDTDTGAVQCILNKGSGGYMATVHTTDQAALDKGGMGGVVANTTATVPADGSWHHYAMTRTGSASGQTHIYVDGVEDTSFSTVTTYTDNSNAVTIGVESSGTNTVSGAIAYLALYKTALSPTRVAAHFDASASSVTVTPDAASLALTSSAPTVTASDHKLVVPAAASLATSTAAPLISLGLAAVPSKASLATTTFAPTVVVTANQVAVPATAALALLTFAPQLRMSVTPSTATLSTATFAPQIRLSVVPATTSFTLGSLAPTVSVSNNQSAVPGTAGLGTTTFAPQVRLTVTPGVAALALGGFAPIVTFTASQTVVPGVAALALTPFVPLVTGGAGLTVVPGTLSITVSALAPTVTATANQTAVPSTAALALATFAPTVSATANRVVIPATALLTLLGVAPTVTGSVTDVRGTVGAVVGVLDSTGARAVLRDTVVIAYGPGASSGATVTDGASVGATASVRDSVGADHA